MGKKRKKGRGRKPGWRLCYLVLASLFLFPWEKKRKKRGRVGMVTKAARWSPPSSRKKKGERDSWPWSSDVTSASRFPHTREKKKKEKGRGEGKKQLAFTPTG